jgi:Domain of unknown function (DUF4249)
MKQYRIIVALLLTLSLASCEKVVNVDLKNATPVIVIEGIVDNSGSPAKVLISKTVPFSTNNVYPAVTGAVVKIADNLGNNFTLAESPKGTYTNATLIGVPGRTYTLNITSEGKNYTAISTMPQQVAFDTIFQEKIFFNKVIKLVTASFDDPQGFGNYYNFVQTINGKRNKNIFTLDDLYQDGGTIDNQIIDQDANLKTGDVVQIEMQCINKVAYRYLVGLQDLSGGNTVPANPDSNISNSALGYFSAHTSEKKTINIQ